MLATCGDGERGQRKEGNEEREKGIESCEKADKDDSADLSLSRGLSFSSVPARRLAQPQR